MIYTLAVILAFYSFAPIYYLAVISFSWASDVLTVPSPLFPPNPTLANYLRIFGYWVTNPLGQPLRPAGQYRELMQGIKNAAIIGVANTIITMAAAVPAGYVLGRYRIQKKNWFIFLLLGTRTIPPASIVVPYYLMYVSLGLRDTYIGLILLHLTMTIPLMTWILMGFFATLPRDLEKAARIDGCGRITAFTKIVLPLTKPAIATCAILTFLFSWNEFLFGRLLSGGGGCQPFTPYLMTFFNNMTVDTSMFASAVMTNLLPALIIALILQKYITSIRIVDPVSVVIE